MAGGALESLGDSFVLALGQAFNIPYKKSLSGKYTNELRPFRVDDDGTSVQVVKGTPGGSCDPELGRRHMNLVPAIRADGTRGLTVYGGVFTQLGGPWYRPIDIDRQQSSIIPSMRSADFQQRLCQYSCPALPIHQASDQSMYTLFFGGISEVYYSATMPDGFQLDTGLPFVDHVGCIGRTATSAKEWLVCKGGSGSPVPLRLPDLLGTTAQFVPLHAVQTTLYNGGVLELGSLTGQTLVGHIYGGIVGTTVAGGATTASKRIFEVYLTAVPSTGLPVASGMRIFGPRL